jgi:hypothetical protein
MCMKTEGVFQNRAYGEGARVVFFSYFIYKYVPDCFRQGEAVKVPIPLTFSHTSRLDEANLVLDRQP